MMEKTVTCNCKTGCRTGRCKCLRGNEPCGDACGCIDCANPLNGVDVDQLSLCAIQNITRVRALTEAELAAPVEMPCGHGPVVLKQLLKGYHCPGCDDELYWYSFCYNAVVQDSCT